MDARVFNEESISNDTGVLERVMITVHPRIMERMQARIDKKPPSGVRFRK